ncbi:hypothetical protein Dsin_000761 [Dipteronia sinensis]|uniref:RNase H type-1 domain-containing protein n=1 Tax=Dipteronia sinensis TaxID=43782 RepID=A0AAE0EJN8_9ROSI|nr:hypothetical protein Dsin_000761 [Dipteronia sinensis]
MACLSWIPTVSNLYYRKIPVDDRCPSCRGWGELMIHSFLKVDELELLCTILWRVWFIRNAGLHGKQQMDISDVVDWATNFLVEYKNSSSGESVVQRQIRGGPAKWSPPCPGVYKINCNAAIDSKNSQIGVGIVIKDSYGAVMASSSQVFAAAYNTQITEAMGLLRAILSPMIVACFHVL